MDHRLQLFRQLLREKHSTFSPRALEELEESAKFVVRLYLGKPKRLRPSAVARELKAMAKGLKRAAEVSLARAVTKAAERYHGEKHGTEGRDRSGKKRSLRTNWKGFRQSDQEHVGGDCVGGQAQGQGPNLGAGKERTPQGKGLIEEANRGVAKKDASIFARLVVFYFMRKDNPPNCEPVEHVFKFTILSRPCVMKALRGACAILVVFAY
jgi:hypothetical protein